MKFGKSNSTRNRYGRQIETLADLSLNERCVLQHVARYRLTTRSGWRGAVDLNGIDQGRRPQIIRNLTQAGLLERHHLVGSNHYFALSAAGALLLGKPPEQSGMLSTQATYRALGQLLFATTGKSPRVLATREEVQQKFAADAHGLPRGIYFEAERPQRWGMVRIDVSFVSTPQHAAQSIRRAVLHALARPAVRHSYQQGDFHFAWVAASPARMHAVLNKFSNYRDLRPLLIHPVLVPGLIPLMRQRPCKPR
jgi:hypothetical protein